MQHLTSTKSRRGNVMLLVLVVVLTIASISAGLIQLQQASTRRQAASMNRKLAFYMAEAGLAEAYAGLVIGKTGNVGSQAAPAVLGNGLFWVEATEDPDHDQVALECTAFVQNGRAVLAMVVERHEPSVASLGVFADAQLDIPPGTWIDGFDSAEGPYRGSESKSPAPTGMGKLGSNNDVNVAGTEALPTTVDGDLTPGPEGVVTLSDEDHVRISGFTEPAPASVPLPPVELPSHPLTKGVNHANGVPLLIGPGEHGMEFLRVRSDAQAVFVGPATVLLGSLLLEEGAELVFNTADGKIDLFVTEAIDLQPGSTVATNVQDSTYLNVQVPGATESALRFGSTAAFQGVIYAPEATVVVGEAFEVFGALVGKEVGFAGPVRLHFDRYLVTASVESSLPTLLTWRIVELSTPSDMGHSLSPFEYLGVDPAVLPRPSQAHADQLIDLTYVSKSGKVKAYNGMESAFDWDLAAGVIGLSRDGKAVGEVQEARSDSTLELIADTSINSSDLKTSLLALGALEDSALRAAAYRDPKMNSSDLKDVLNNNNPLHDSVLQASIQCGALASSDLKDVLINNSPLSADVLADIADGSLTAGDLASVLAAQ